MGFRGLRRELLRWHRGAALDLLGGRSQTDRLRRRGRLFAQRVEERSGRKVPRMPIRRGQRGRPVRRQGRSMGRADQEGGHAPLGFGFVSACLSRPRILPVPSGASASTLFDRLRATTCMTSYTAAGPCEFAHCAASMRKTKITNRNQNKKKKKKKKK